MDVEIVDRQGRGVDHALIERAAQMAHKIGGGGISTLSIVLLDDEGISELNRQLLGRDGPTDVIAFEAEETPEGTAAEVYINTDAAHRQGQEYGLGFDGELCFLVAHAVLHALGYDDATDAGRERMFRLQHRVVETLGFAGDTA